MLLTAEQGPQARYTAWLKVLRGHVQVVVGNRSAAYAPVRDLGLVAVWDDGDDLHEEPRAPYPHSREVALLRSRLEGAAILIGGFTRTVAAAALVEQGMLRTVAGAPAQARRCVPGIVVAGEGLEPERDPGARAARIPTLAWRTAHEALARGPVLVQVPRAGYVPTLACASCRTLARCTECHGPGVGGSAARRAGGAGTSTRGLSARSAREASCVHASSVRAGLPRNLGGPSRERWSSPRAPIPC